MEVNLRPRMSGILTRPSRHTVWRASLALVSLAILIWVVWSAGASRVPAEDRLNGTSGAATSSQADPNTSADTTAPAASIPSPGAPSAAQGSSGSNAQRSREKSAIAAAAVPRPAPETLEPEELYFPETGHFLVTFKKFWERSGGKVVFGPPLTEEFQEEDPATGELRSVQYFASQRLQYHRAFAGTPYEVQLALLGVEDATRRQILDTEPFQRLSASQQRATDCVFFPQTGHFTCGAFRAFWERNGLEFGDAGLTYRESLALFGYPISEEFTSSTTGLVVQYFERARLEYRLNQTDSAVAVSWLGADALAQDSASH